MITLDRKKYIHASEIQVDLGISSGAAYRLVKQLNNQLSNINPLYHAFPGNVPRDYYRKCVNLGGDNNG